MNTRQLDHRVKAEIQKTVNKYTGTRRAPPNPNRQAGWPGALCIDDMCVMCRVLKQSNPAACASRGRWGGWEGGNRCLHTLAYFQE